MLCATYFELKGWNLSSLIVIHHPRFTRTRKSFHNIIRREILTFGTKRNLLGKSRHLAIYLQKLSCCQSDFWIPQLPDQIKISSNLVWNSFSDTQFLKKDWNRHSGTVRSESESSQWKVFIVIAFKVMFFSLREYTVIGKKRRFLSLGSFMKRQAPDNCSREMNCPRKKTHSVNFLMNRQAPDNCPRKKLHEKKIAREKNFLRRAPDNWQE